ncbi:MAG: hypothetical protein KDD82_11525, partial [Planctomycetes bacterium]|nr:hypothetical protein [Planctomycetota bacterium]
AEERIDGWRERALAGREADGVDAAGSGAGGVRGAGAAARVHGTRVTREASLGVEGQELVGVAEGVSRPRLGRRGPAASETR